jgi:dihydroxyacid dehydratase/phosphogluconate dehydratase
MVIAGRGPLGSGMEETAQVTMALKFLPFGKHVALLTDARFSGVSTGACVGHVSPEALEGGPIGRLRDGDRISIVVDRIGLTGSIDLVGHGDEEWSADEADAVLASRPIHPGIAPDPDLPADTALWAKLQSASGGLWGGCVYDPDAIVELLDEAVAARRARSLGD